MKSLGIGLGCVVVAAGLFFGLVKGVRLLVEPELAVRPEARMVPPSPRIARSVERKPSRLPEAELRPLAPITHEANAALPIQPAARLREPGSPTSAKRRRQPHVAERVIEHRPELSWSAAKVTTARTDFPY
jgi:hypothetical protein